LSAMLADALILLQGAVDRSGCPVLVEIDASEPAPPDEEESA